MATMLVLRRDGGGFLIDGSAQRAHSGILDSTHPSIVQNEALFSSVDEHDLHKVKRGVLDYHLEPSHAPTSNPQRSDANHPIDIDRPLSSNAAAEVAPLEKISNLAFRESSVGALRERENVDRWKFDPSRAYFAVVFDENLPGENHFPIQVID
ncbi:PREDICTED: MAP3K epsilon protein kinase 1-like isoform X2 [Lupinus angustifolius]|uniref:MAP3K epsilon protein kinase 1-like isoform X2 n=1 Tax=Lupinus angustifolius TaxID=3871 RepID=UPI00092F54C8|nr:PREDICTED: MAP3K epsilon protein kinase 1-like isoform X2 [Lupinus angustifolius]